MSKIFAAFAIGQTLPGILAATTRAADRGEMGRIGLPGGKLEEGETAIQAAVREASEEGWKFHGECRVVEVKELEGNLIAWVQFKYPPKKLKNFKEKGRISPITVSVEKISDSGYGNEFISDLFGEDGNAMFPMSYEENSEDSFAEYCSDGTFGL